ncbi:PIN domain-containing protein [Blastococcus sp. DSM 46786]|uniref:PIN domain-containing protein n=1 Tax=Blastococcus sp. DSM 46786 TaxID=1798227 RepID=UPI0008BFEC73|nr:PIN domain-containing protein [Blastococcus sp. DSM 46786]SEL95336.1 PIN domain-containing protein [Blastococcus sp. DSM 46786]
MIYLDSSAILKLVRAEEHSAALAAWLTDRPDVPLVSSALAPVEVLRSCRRIDPRLGEQGRAVLAVLDLVPLDDHVLTAAAELPEPSLRSLDALHLASALALDPDLETFVAYDARLLEAAAAAGLDVSQPGA